MNNFNILESQNQEFIHLQLTNKIEKLPSEIQKRKK